MNRRRFLLTAAAAATAAAFAPRPLQAQSQPLRYADMHTHIGVFRSAGIRDAMTRNGMQLLARKIVADRPVIGTYPGKGFQTMREAAPGELAQYFDARAEKLRAQNRA